MRVLVTGDRVWGRTSLPGMTEQQIEDALRDRKMVDMILDGIASRSIPMLVVIEGGAPGADHCAANWCEQHSSAWGVSHMQFPAQWDLHGKAAGPIRNRKMLSEASPELVIAFHHNLADSRGTKDMVSIARKANVPVYIVS